MENERNARSNDELRTDGVRGAWPHFAVRAARCTHHVVALEEATSRHFVGSEGCLDLLDHVVLVQIRKHHNRTVRCLRAVPPTARPVENQCAENKNPVEHPRIRMK